MTTVKCPNCQTEVVWRSDNPNRPFCSERCKLMDFGSWANESYAIASDETAENGTIQ
ncbi:MAG: DNA gyrase inhibitor YacG [Neisseria sp.]|nr:DNA gyrase inhibitor YacG [Neisseria sp.]